MRVMMGMAMILIGAIPARLAMKDKKEHAKAVEGCHEDAHQQHHVDDWGSNEVRCPHRLDDHVLGIKAGKERRTDERKRSQEIDNIGDWHLAPEASHLANVLLMVHADDHGSGSKEKQALKKAWVTR